MKDKINHTPNTIRCSWCGQITSIIWVHGHGQCKICRTNVDECCRGECKTKDQTD